ncbi:(2Fe-2S)-binding protein [Ferrimonas aestuarii]|uniref:(2Fe-2S)-binding protein n=1 Tax=Ferrimonas aestuarii TaxID=2569539 RepID=A0A4U1BK35_9GAMM|nr:(2Fe-2S)-binding protein [Ferrimonas aestuarii]TKB51857.1 (2Fe-2S)-binding protein [Ferrimonas aestuarii]
MKLNFTLNHQPQSLEISATMSVLELLRERLNLSACKEGCGEGECGACSILVNDKLVNSCLLASAQLEGAEVMTLEGLRETDKGRCLIEALLEAKGVQCGFCSPGMVLALYALLNENRYPTDDQIREALSGNLCRCTGYGMIIDAAHIALKRGKGLW